MSPSAADELTIGLEKTAQNLFRISELLREMDMLRRMLPDGDAAHSTPPPTAWADAAPVGARVAKLPEKAGRLRKRLRNIRGLTIADC